MKVIRQTISIQNLKILKSEIALESSSAECIKFLKFQKTIHSFVFKVVVKPTYILINQNKVIIKYLLK